MSSYVQLEKYRFHPRAAFVRLLSLHSIALSALAISEPIPTILPECRLGMDIMIVKREARRRIQVMREADAKASASKVLPQVEWPFSSRHMAALYTLEINVSDLNASKELLEC